ncbi:hypothetical protein FGO68_gene7491 [Halteria grandinella]|uniref:Uncharacterized protein n=1 Tax=Halteria grandinella TaxID=5974 RepID=A0A8J8T811_HALGN|nr:hypothetical protein FGO68_gene7491 [Halteria grandinella]
MYGMRDCEHRWSCLCKNYKIQSIKGLKPKEDLAQADIHQVEILDALLDEERLQYGSGPRKELSLQLQMIRNRMADLICVLAEKTKQREHTKHYALAYLETFLRLCDGAPNFLGTPAQVKNEVILAPLCLLLGSKYDEIDSNIPQITSLLRVLNRSIRLSNIQRNYSRPASTSGLGNIASWSAAASTLTYDDMINAERQGVQLLGWNLMKVTSHQIIECLIQIGLISSEDQCTDSKPVDQVRLKKVIRDALELNEHGTLDYELSCSAKPSEIAIAAVISARTVNHLQSPLPGHIQIQMDAQQPCIDKLIGEYRLRYEPLRPRAYLAQSSQQFPKTPSSSQHAFQSSSSGRLGNKENQDLSTSSNNNHLVKRQNSQVKLQSRDLSQTSRTSKASVFAKQSSNVVGKNEDLKELMQSVALVEIVKVDLEEEKSEEDKQDERITDVQIKENSQQEGTDVGREDEANLIIANEDELIIAEHQLTESKQIHENEKALSQLPIETDAPKDSRNPLQQPKCSTSFATQLPPQKQQRPSYHKELHSMRSLERPGLSQSRQQSSHREPSSNGVYSVFTRKTSQNSRPIEQPKLKISVVPVAADQVARQSDLLGPDERHSMPMSGRENMSKTSRAQTNRPSTTRYTQKNEVVTASVNLSRIQKKTDGKVVQNKVPPTGKRVNQEIIVTVSVNKEQQQPSIRTEKDVENQDINVQPVIEVLQNPKDQRFRQTGKSSNRPSTAINNYLKTIDPKDQVSHTALLSPKHEEKDFGLNHRLNLGPQTTLASDANTPNSKSKTRRASLSTNHQVPSSTTNQNFIKRNISYIASLNNHVKEKKLALPEETPAPKSLSSVKTLGNNGSTNQKGGDFSTSMKKHALNMPKFEIDEPMQVSEPQIIKRIDSQMKIISVEASPQMYYLNTEIVETQPPILPQPLKQQLYYEYLKPTVSSMQRNRQASKENTRNSRRKQSQVSTQNINHHFQPSSANLSIFSTQQSSHNFVQQEYGLRSNDALNGEHTDELTARLIESSIVPIPSKMSQRNQGILNPHKSSSKHTFDKNTQHNFRPQPTDTSVLEPSSQSSRLTRVPSKQRISAVETCHSSRQSIERSSSAMAGVQIQSTKHSQRKSITRTFNQQQPKSTDQSFNLKPPQTGKRPQTALMQRHQPQNHRIAHAYSSAIQSNANKNSFGKGASSGSGITGSKVISTSQVMIIEELGEDDTIHIFKGGDSIDSEIPPQA